MVKNARKHQKKQERKRKKQKAHRTQLAQRKNLGMAQRMHVAAAAPILHCVVSSDLYNEGIGYVLISRRQGPAEVAFASFLVDRYCLGVKNVFGDVLPISEYRQRIYDSLQNRFELETIDEETAYLIVQGSVDYAQQFSLLPHRNYRKYAPLLGTHDAPGREPPIEFGRDGKPLYIRGPSETLRDFRRIVSLLRYACGDDGFHYILGGTIGELEGGELLEMLDQDEVDEDSEDSDEPSVLRLRSR